MGSIETPHFLIQDGRVRPRSDRGGISHELPDPNAPQPPPPRAGPPRAAAGTRARLAAADVLALPVADQAVDTVLAVHVLEHLPAEVSALALAQLRRVARHRVVIAVPLEEVPDPTFGHVQAFDLPRLARIGDAPGWSRAVHAEDGGAPALDPRAGRPPRRGMGGASAAHPPVREAPPGPICGLRP